MSETAAPPPDPVAAAPVAAAPAPEPAVVPAAAVEQAPAAATPEPVAVAPAIPEQSLLSTPPDPNAEPTIPVGPTPVAYEAFTAPEGVTLDQDAVKPYAEILGQAGVPQDVAQSLVNKYIEQQQADRARALDAWAQQRSTWRDQFIKDPEIGGNRQATTLARAAEAIDRFSGSPENAAAVRKALNDTGAGDHPALIRVFANMMKALSEGRPVPAVMAKAPSQVSGSRSRYNNSPSLPLNGAA